MGEYGGLDFAKSIKRYYEICGLSVKTKSKKFQNDPKTISAPNRRDGFPRETLPRLGLKITINGP
jgi:hypothetical protein